MSKNIVYKANSKTGMTGYELYQYLQDAEAQGFDLKAPVKVVTTGWSQGIRDLTFTAE